MSYPSPRTAEWKQSTPVEGIKGSVWNYQKVTQIDIYLKMTKQQCNQNLITMKWKTLVWLEIIKNSVCIVFLWKTWLRLKMTTDPPPPRPEFPTLGLSSLSLCKWIPLIQDIVSYKRWLRKPFSFCWKYFIKIYKNKSNYLRSILEETSSASVHISGFLNIEGKKK